MADKARRVGSLFVLLVVAMLAVDAHADLFIQIRPMTVPLKAGESAEITIQSQPQPGFPEAAATIEYNLSGVPGVTGERVTTTAPFPPVSMRLTAGSDAPPGTSPGTIDAVVRDASGAQIGDKSFPAVVAINVAAAVSGDYEVSISPNPISVRDREMFTFTITSVGGFSGSVAVSMGTSGNVVALDKTCAPGTFCPYQQRMYDVPAGGSATDQAIASATGVGGGRIVLTTMVPGGRERQTALDVTTIAPAPPAFNFAIPPSVDVQGGQELDLPLLIEGSNGWSGSIDVRVYPPPGITVEPDRFALNTGEQRMVRVRVAPDSPGGTLTLQAQTTVGGQLLLKEARVQVNVSRPAPVGDFVVEVEPMSLDLSPGERKPLTISVRSTGGFSGLVPYASAVTSGNDLHIVDGSCTPERNAAECPDLMTGFNVAPNATTQSRIFVQAGATATPGEIAVTIRDEARGDKRAVARVNIVAAAPPPPPVPGGLPCGSGLSCYAFELQPATLTIARGKSHPATIRMTRPDGDLGPTTLVIEPSRELVDAFVSFQAVSFGPGETTRDVQVTIRPDTPPGNRRFYVDARVTDPRAAGVDPATLTRRTHLDIEVPQPAKAGYRLRLDTPSLELGAGGEPKTVHVTLEPVGEFNDGVSIALDGYHVDAPVEVQFPDSVFQAGQYGPKPIIIRAKSGVQPGPFTMTVRGSTTYPDQYDQSSVELPINIVAGPEYVTVVEPNILELTSGGDAREVTVRVVGVRGWNGNVTVTPGNVAGIDAGGPFTIAAGESHRLQIRATDGAVAGYDSVLSLLFTPGKRGAADYEEVIRLNVTRPAAAEFALEMTQPMLIVPAGRPGIVTVRVLPVNQWSGPVTVSVDSHPEWAIVNPPNVVVPSLPGEATFEVTRTSPVGASSQVTFRGTAGATVNTVQMPVELSVGRGPIVPGRPGRDPDQPGRGGPEEWPEPPLESEPVPGGPLTYVTPGLVSVARNVSAENGFIDGFEAVTASSSWMNPEAAQAQKGFLDLHNAIIAQLQSPADLIAFTEGDPEIDPELLARMIEGTGVFERHAELHRAVYQVASLTPAPLAIINLDNPIDPPSSASQKIRWSDYTEAERLVVMISLRRLAENFQPGFGRMRDVLSEFEDFLGKVGAEDQAEKLKKGQKAFRALALAGGLVVVADISAKAVLAFLPNEITGFHTVINDHPRRPGDPAVEIKKGTEANIKVLIRSKSPGGTVVSPGEIGGMIWDAISGDPRVSALIDAADRSGMKALLNDDLKKWIAARIPGVTALQQWLEHGWDIKPFYNEPVEANSTRILFIRSNDENILEARSRPLGPRSRSFHFYGAQPAPGGIGYTFGLRESLASPLQRACTEDCLKTGLWKVEGYVKVIDDTPKAGPCGPGLTPPNYGRMCRYNEDGSMTICPPGAKDCIGVIGCDGTCGYPK